MKKSTMTLLVVAGVGVAYYLYKKNMRLAPTPATLATNGVTPTLAQPIAVATAPPVGIMGIAGINSMPSVFNPFSSAVNPFLNNS